MTDTEEFVPPEVRELVLICHDFLSVTEEVHFADWLARFGYTFVQSPPADETGTKLVTAMTPTGDVITVSITMTGNALQRYIDTRDPNNNAG